MLAMASSVLNSGRCSSATGSNLSRRVGTGGSRCRKSTLQCRKIALSHSARGFHNRALRYEPSQGAIRVKPHARILLSAHFAG